MNSIKVEHTKQPGKGGKDEVSKSNLGDSGLASPSVSDLLLTPLELSEN